MKVVSLHCYNNNTFKLFLSCIDKSTSSLSFRYCLRAYHNNKQTFFLLLPLAGFGLTFASGRDETRGLLAVNTAR